MKQEDLGLNSSSFGDIEVTLFIMMIGFSRCSKEHDSRLVSSGLVI